MACRRGGHLVGRGSRKFYRVCEEATVGRPPDLVRPIDAPSRGSERCGNVWFGREMVARSFGWSAYSQRPWMPAARHGFRCSKTLRSKHADSFVNSVGLQGSLVPPRLLPLAFIAPTPFRRRRLSERPVPSDSSLQTGCCESGTATLLSCRSIPGPGRST